MKFIQLFIYLLSCTFLVAQQSSAVNGKAMYSFSHIRDTTNRNKVKSENMILFFENQKSLYRSYTSYMRDSLENSPNKNAQFAQVQNNSVIKIKPTINQIIITDFAQNNQFIIQPWMGDTLEAKNRIDKINWQLIDSLKSISNMMCSFAKGDYKGHTYYVWYAQDIPLKFGPWKLQGLPGLIVEAKDDRNTISFQLLTFETNNGIVINTPSLSKKFITEKKVKEIMKSFMENPNAYLDAMTAQNSSNGTNISASLQMPANTKQILNSINNPLEKD